MKIKSSLPRRQKNSAASLRSWRSAQKRPLKRKQRVATHKLLRASWKYQGKIFFVESTLHGVRYIAECDRPIIERLIWFICVMVGAISTMVIIVSLWEKFQTNPTITGLDTDFHNWDIPFPAISLCPNQPWNENRLKEFVDKISTEKQLDPSITEKFTNFLKRLTQLSFASLQDNNFAPEFDAILQGQDLNKVVYSLMDTCEDFLKECKWKTNPYKCCDGFFPSFTENGFCFTYNSKHYERVSPSGEKFPEVDINYMKETDPKLSLQFSIEAKNVNSAYNVSIYLHKANEIPGKHLKPQHVWDFKMGSMSFSMRETYTTDDATQLSIKQRHCIYDHEMHLEIDRNYTYSACAYQCRMNNARRLCSCIPHFYKLTADYKHCSVSQLKCVADNKEKIGNIEKCGCELGCSNTIYEVDKLDEAKVIAEEPESGLDYDQEERDDVQTLLKEMQNETLGSFGGGGGESEQYKLFDGGDDDAELVRSVRQVEDNENDGVDEDNSDIGGDSESNDGGIEENSVTINSETPNEMEDSENSENTDNPENSSENDENSENTPENSGSSDDTVENTEDPINSEISDATTKQEDGENVETSEQTEGNTENPENAETPQDTEISDNPKNTNSKNTNDDDNSGNSENTENPENSGNSEDSVTSENETPENSESPGDSENSDDSETPENSENSEEPEDSDNPDNPEDSDSSEDPESSGESGPKLVSFECEFTSWPMIKYKREVLFGWVDLLVSFGGIAGLFLGFSLLSGVEIIYYFTIRACCMVYKQRDELEKMVLGDEGVEEKSRNDFDVGLGPYFINGRKQDNGGDVLRRRMKENAKFKMIPVQPMIVKPINKGKKVVVPPFGIDYYN